MPDWTRVLWTVMVLAMTGAIGGTYTVITLDRWYSDRPTPGGRNLDSPPQEHPRGEHQNATAYQTGSKERPIFVDIGHTPRSQREADQEAAKEFRDAATQWGVLVLTGVLAFATIMQFGALFYQGLWLRRSVVVAERALTDLERAYLFVEVLPSLPDSAQFMVRHDSIRVFKTIVRIRNHGKTPAILKKIRAHFAISDRAPICLLPDITGGEDIPAGLAISSGECLDHDVTIDLLPASERDLHAQSTGLFICGEITYDDILQKDHRTGFCWHVGGSTIIKCTISPRTPLNYRT